jgi:hypothetical protein
MFITINKKRQKELQWYIDKLLQEGWIEIRDYYESNPSIERKSAIIKLQKLI